MSAVYCLTRCLAGLTAALWNCVHLMHPPHASSIAEVMTSLSSHTRVAHQMELLPFLLASPILVRIAISASLSTVFLSVSRTRDGAVQ